MKPNQDITLSTTMSKMQCLCRGDRWEIVYRLVFCRSGCLAPQEGCTVEGPELWEDFRYKPGGWHYHHGNPADERMIAAGSKRGLELTSISRPLVPTDLSKFDYIVAMVVP